MLAKRATVEFSNSEDLSKKSKDKWTRIFPSSIQVRDITSREQYKDII